MRRIVSLGSFGAPHFSCGLRMGLRTWGMKGRWPLNLLRWTGKLGICLCGFVIVAFFQSSVQTSIADWVELSAVTIACALSWGIGEMLLKRPPMPGLSVEAKTGVIAVTKVFLALSFILAGGLILIAFATERIDYLEDNVFDVAVGIVLFASGLTFIWTQKVFHKP
jgi:hypothetical protein